MTYIKDSHTDLNQQYWITWSVLEPHRPPGCPKKLLFVSYFVKYKYWTFFFNKTLPQAFNFCTQAAVKEVKTNVKG